MSSRMGSDGEVVEAGTEAGVPTEVVSTETTAGHGGERVALGVFVLAWSAAFPILLHAGRDQWFFLDEWSFLAVRELSDVGSLFEPHNEHWVTLPVILYRLTFAMVGLNHYWPYLLLVISAHLATAALLRVVMRRAGAGPWPATGGAVLFAYLGSGGEDLGWGFQVGFSMALACGLADLVLADQDSRKVTRRDLVAVGFGLAALMSTGIGVFMVLAVGMATLLRRGWRVAAFHVVPLGGLYMLWYVVQAPTAAGAAGSTSPVLGLTGQFLFDTAEGVAGGGVATWVLLALVFGGLAWAVAGQPSLVRGAWSGVVSLLVAGVAFAFATAYGRRQMAIVFDDMETAGRYVHVLAAMSLPAAVVSVDWLVRRNRVFVPIAAVLLVGALLSNVSSLKEGQPWMAGRPRFWVAAADLAAEYPVPADVTLDPDLPGVGWGVSARWLRHVRSTGDMPELPDVPRSVRDEAQFRLFARQVEPSRTGCEEADPGPVSLQPGEEAHAHLRLALVNWMVDGEVRASVSLASEDLPIAVEATTEPVVIEITALDGGATVVSRCR